MLMPKKLPPSQTLRDFANHNNFISLPMRPLGTIDTLYCANCKADRTHTLAKRSKGLDDQIGWKCSANCGTFVIVTVIKNVRNSLFG